MDQILTQWRDTVLDAEDNVPALTMKVTFSEWLRKFCTDLVLITYSASLNFHGSFEYKLSKRL